MLFEGSSLTADCLFVGGEAPSVLEGLPDISVLLGEDATMECQISGKPEPSVTW